MKLVFCGTPEFAVPSLQALVDAGHQVELVLTQPDRPAGRKMELQAPAVKQRALQLDLSIVQPDKIRNNNDLQRFLQAIHPDAIIVVAYGRILPQWMLDLPRFGCINVHGSLLPKYRGAAPIQWAVANGEPETGVTTMRLDAGLDTGDTLLFHRISLDSSTTAAELYPQLASDGAALLLKTLEGLEAGTLVPQPQDHAAATLAPILTREDGRLRPNEQTAQVAYNRWRGFSPWPGCWCQFRNKRFILNMIHLKPAVDDLRPGELRMVGDELCLGMASGTVLVLDEVQLEGKPRLSGVVFSRDFQVKPGECIA
jgi:methionyl-tRNA formyltransferase